MASRVGTTVLKIVLVAAIGGLGAALGGIALRAPVVDVGDRQSSGIVVWPNVEQAPVAIDLNLGSSGRVDFQVVSEFPAAPGTDAQGRFVASSDFEKATVAGPAVEQIADVVYLQVRCGDAFDVGSLRLPTPAKGQTDEAKVTFLPAGGGCAERDGVSTQTIVVKLQTISPTQFVTDIDHARSYGVGGAMANFSIVPVRPWTDSSLDRRVSRTPTLIYGVAGSDELPAPAGAAGAGPFSVLRATAAGGSADVLDLMVPDSTGNGDAESQAVTWSAVWNDQVGLHDSLPATFVRWTNPAGSSWVQGLLLAAGVLLGVAASLATEFLVQGRGRTHDRDGGERAVRRVRRMQRPLI